jgi:hypothetical protein
MSATNIQALGEALASRELFLNFFLFWDNFGQPGSTPDPDRHATDGSEFSSQFSLPQKRISRKPPSVSCENPFTCTLPTQQGEGGTMTVLLSC